MIFLSIVSVLRLGLLIRLQDWQLGGKCEVYGWGSGRHGQLAETGRGSTTAVLLGSFSSAQQVSR